MRWSVVINTPRTFADPKKVMCVIERKRETKPN